MRGALLFVIGTMFVGCSSSGLGEKTSETPAGDGSQTTRPEDRPETTAATATTTANQTAGTNSTAGTSSTTGTTDTTDTTGTTGTGTLPVDTGAGTGAGTDATAGTDTAGADLVDEGTDSGINVVDPEPATPDTGADELEVDTGSSDVSCDPTVHDSVYLDGLQTQGDGRVIFCHSADGSNHHLIQTDISSCPAHQAHEWDVFPSTGCDT